MFRCPGLLSAAAASVLVVGGGFATRACAIGYWNMPGSFAQWSGVGWGAGYHAKFVLGPITPDGALAHNEVRLPYPPQPPHSYYGCGYNSHDCGYGEAWVTRPSVLPAAGPRPVEPNSLPAAGAAPRPLFGPPVEP